MLPVETSIDKITLVGDIRCKKQFEHEMNDVKNNYIQRYSSNPTGFPYIHSWNMVDGSFVQVAAPEANVPGLRIEGNPNKWMRSKIKPILSHMKNARPTRLDYAMDYFEDLGNMVWFDTKARTRRMYVSGSGKLQTLYIGAPESEQMYRIYNKALEQKESGVKWRVELVHKYKPSDKQYVSRDLFSDIYAVLPKADNVEESAMLEYLLHHPEAMGMLSQYQRKKYKSTMAIKAQKMFNPYEGYLQCRNNLKEQLHNIIECTDTYKARKYYPAQEIVTPF